MRCTHQVQATKQERGEEGEASEQTKREATLVLASKRKLLEAQRQVLERRRAQQLRDVRNHCFRSWAQFCHPPQPSDLVLTGLKA